MLKGMLNSSAMVLVSLSCIGCDAIARHPKSGDGYPPVLPIWIVEDDPNQTIFTRKDLERDRKVGKMLVIPLYRYFLHQGATDFLAIAHPFVYQQGEDIEKRLSSFGQREKLRRLIFWVPGYFPVGMGRIFPWVPIINGKRMIVLQLQPCIGAEASQINSAMKTLLMDGDFLIGKTIILEVPPIDHAVKSTRLTGELRTAIEPYDADRVVRTMEYNGRYYDDGGVLNIHVLWAFTPGTRIVNRLTADEKKLVAAFAAEVTKKTAIETPDDKKESHK
jgi:hypothetical protein